MSTTAIFELNPMDAVDRGGVCLMQKREMRRVGTDCRRIVWLNALVAA